MIKVSILVPIYNVEKYLAECLESLVQQTLEEIEIICINDGSTDNSLNIINKYAKQDKRIKVIDKVNTGYGNTMNIGMQNAAGEYIGIVESDDFAASDMFEKLYDAAVEQNAEIVKSNFYYYKAEQGESLEFVELLKGCKYNTVFSPMDDKSVYLVDPQIWSSIYKREFLQEHKIRFNETPGASYQDIFFSFQVWFHAKRALLKKEAYLHYRVDNPNSSVKAPNKIFCVCDEYEAIENFLQGRTYDLEINYVETAMKLQGYLWTYFRIAGGYQYAFLLRLLKELKHAEEEELLKQIYWREHNWSYIQRVIKNPERFYLETYKDYHDERIDEMTLNSDVYFKGLMNEIRQASHIIIYGAGIIGNVVLKALIRHQITNIIAIAVTDTQGNPQMIDDIPVRPIDELEQYKESGTVLVSVKYINQIDIIRKLKDIGFKNIISLDKKVLHMLDNK